MGCAGFQVMDEETAKLLASLDRKVEEFHETFEKDVKEIKDKQDKQLKERHQELLKLKETESITEQAIKDLNKKELKVEIDILSNAVNKMHYIFDVGLDLVEPLRKITIDKLLEKAKSAPAITVNKIKSQIEDVKKIPVIDFLSSTYGKVLANALEKKGMSEAFLKSTKKSLLACMRLGMLKLECINPKGLILLTN